MNIYKINTTAYTEEDFYVMTTLNEQDIIEVINPIVNAQRDGYEEYDNDSLILALQNRYPKDVVTHYNEIEIISI